MKGIRKLFLGLILLTLFGVGFKVEAKAANGLSLTKSTDTNKTLVGTFTTGNNNVDFPHPKEDGTVSFIYTYTLIDSVTGNNDPTQPKTTQTVILTTVRDSAASQIETYSVKINGVDDTTKNAYELFSLTQAQVRDMVKAATDSNDETKTVKYKLKATFSIEPAIPDGKTIADIVTNDPVPSNIGETPADGVEFSVGRVKPGVYFGDATIAGATVSVDGTAIPAGGYYYMYAGETKTFVTSGVESDYKYVKWTADHGTLGTIQKGSAVFTMATPVAATELKELYGKLRFVPDIDTDTIVVPGVEKDIPYVITGFPNGKNDIESVTCSPTITGATFTFGTEYFVINVPAGAASGAHTLTIKMKDDAGGAVYTKTFTVADNASIVLSDEIKVTEDEKIALTKYVLSAGSMTMSVNAKATNTAASHVSVVGSNGKGIALPAALNSIYIHGKSATSKTGVQAFTVTSATDKSATDTTVVTVYPRPSITLNSSDSSSGSSLNSSTSSSSSSADSPFKVTMPTGVYHDDVAYDTVKKAKIKFHRSDKDDKYATLDLGSSSSSSSLTKSASANSLAVTDILNDLCGDDSSYTIKLTAYPMDGDSDRYDDDVYATEEFTAYKITLDGSGGAKYTVNGREMSGQFYAVKGTTYTIKSSSANGGKFEKWDDSVFSSESGGSYKVLGAKTFKANYTSTTPTPTPTPTTTPNNNSNMDDYDDVPKTGESKADIWILWTVLFIAILGAGFMIWKRFGLVRAIAAADAEVAIAEEEERIETEKKEKEDKLNMLKDLRNL